MNNEFHYDTVRYPSSVFSQFRPDRIGAMAILHGVTPNRIDDCRVLELGCGDGSSLLSIASSIPRSQCIGVDLSSESIAEAKARYGIHRAFEHQVPLYGRDGTRTRRAGRVRFHHRSRAFFLGTRTGASKAPGDIQIVSRPQWDRIHQLQRVSRMADPQHPSRRWTLRFERLSEFP